MTTLNNIAVALGLAIAGCASDAGKDNLGVGSTEAELQQQAQLVPFTWIDDPKGIGSSTSEVRRVFTSAAQYERIIGHEPPEDVNFAQEIVILFDGGLKRTDGYEANVEKVDYSFPEFTLFVTIAILSPGPQCAVAQEVSHPYALVKLQRSWRPWPLWSVRFVRNDKVIDCDPVLTCDDISCPDEQHCESSDEEPYSVPPHCVPDTTPPVFCGGIAGIECPGLGECNDDPSDDCDPENGGADCGGLCSCPESIACKSGMVFDNAPEYCACIPDPSQDPCASVRCKAGTHCEPLEDEANCVPDAPFCGGIAGIECPGAGSCVDNPDDECDPETGGADCGGFCQCNALGFCLPGYVWDSSPSVCTCVPITNPCASTLCQVGTTCEVIDGAAVCISDGTQECGSNTCDEGSVCCNASCGICTAPGMFCTQQACL